MLGRASGAGRKRRVKMRVRKDWKAKKVQEQRDRESSLLGKDERGKQTGSVLGSKEASWNKDGGRARRRRSGNERDVSAQKTNNRN